MSRIEWTERTWNPTTGCDRVSPGCDHCYALTMARRLKAIGSPKYQTDGGSTTSGPGFGVAVHEDELAKPLRWRTPSMVFVDSMGDLFHTDVPNEFIARVWAVMALTPQNIYQVLTKRHARMRSLLGKESFSRTVVDIVGDHPLLDRNRDQGRWPLCEWDGSLPLPNVWGGVSVEDQQRAELRIPALLDTPLAVRFLSCEPLLGPLDLSPWLGPLDRPPCWDDHPVSGECARCIQPEWVIVGGESGPGARPMDHNWVRSIIEQCRPAGVPLFVKQLGSVWAAGRGKGGDPEAWPEDLRVREFPKTTRS